ncbi:alkylation response protein AidB-like acyl-CoA dehydrogenase [Psychrobacillus insolitus]|uniref:Alkylation response protein AidB-like acyl-CoA dehydrogenase n=1 Tax=Psychrobacillus insolitus TaxID=1461 RepID=A0A2W7ML80_9BACI|nr:acyl-CoA dehydrogenase family protein [Psychrobacillus insolitus]PZX07520.1 alkylation response protein AidB-like acyl-CoA dehydrogenase [Psychrobacillus insolitus]
MNKVLQKEVDIVEKARSLVSGLRERANETEKIRQIPEASMQEFKDAGLFKMLRPKRYGGQEVSMRTYSEVIVEISRGCGSSGWIVALCAIRELMVAQSFSEKTHKEIFDGKEDSVLFAGVYEPRQCIAKKVDGGYLIEEGFWMFCSGSLHATWGYFGMPIIDDEGNLVDQILMTLPFDELEIMDDWHVLGLKGTGSNSVKMHNTFIPDHRCTSFVEALDGNFESTHLRDIPLYHTALFPSLILSLGLPALGLVKYALEFFRETLPNRRAVHMGVDFIKDAASTHATLASASLKIDTAQMHFYRVADELDRWASEKKYMDRHERVKTLADIGYANEVLKEALDLILEASGSGYVYDGHPLQRIYRDFSTLHSHRSLSPIITKENYGRVLAGLESNAVRY